MCLPVLPSILGSIFGGDFHHIRYGVFITNTHFMVVYQIKAFLTKQVHGMVYLYSPMINAKLLSRS